LTASVVIPSLDRVVVPSPSDTTATLVGDELRRRVDTTSSDARLERARLATAETALRETRRAAAEARACLETAAASLDQRGLADRKEGARRDYRTALAAARGSGERLLAAAHWLRAIDQLNRGTRAALGQVLLWRARVEMLDREVHDAEWRATAQRVRAEAAEEACGEARRRLADADRWIPDAPDFAISDEGPGEIDTAMGAARVALVGRVDMPVLRGLLEGGDVARDIARQLAALTGDPPSRWLLLLRTLAEIIVASAIADDRLRFDQAHPLWSQLTPGEARELMHGLRDLGFRYDPHDGWYGDRSPLPRDLALALAFAGIEAIALRPMPTTEELAQLPASISVASIEHLAEHAPTLDLDAVHRLAGSQAPALAEIWDNWADVRALLRGDVPLTVSA
jgi:hypothetical protein